MSSDIDASTLHRFFDDKVAGVRRASTAGADSPTFTTVPVSCELRLFTPVSSADVVELVHERPASMATEAVRRSLSSVPVSTVQLVLVERLCFVDVQVRQHYAVTEESRSGSGRRQVVSTDFQLVRHLEAAGMTG